MATRDIGIVAAIAFDQPGRFTGRAVQVAGDCLTGPQIARTLGRACGLPARFHQLPIEQLRAFDPQVASMFAWMDSGAAREPDLAALRADHPGLMTLQTWLRATGWRPEPATGRQAPAD